jgi:hypothetical protein
MESRPSRGKIVNFKLGCRPFVHTKVSLNQMAVLNQTFKALGPPPATCYPWHVAVESQTQGDWLMLGNDEEGDCVIADDGHKVMVWSANKPGANKPISPIILPTTAEILAYYSAHFGYVKGDPSTDNGADPVANANILKTEGITIGGVVHKIDQWVPVDPTNADALKWATHLFGGVTFCVSLPQSAEDQFGAGEPWTVMDNDGGILGGHDVFNVLYATDVNGVLWWFPVTWGKRQPTSDPWRAKYLTMAIAYLSKDFLNQAGADAAGMDYAGLNAALQSVAEAA